MKLISCFLFQPFFYLIYEGNFFFTGEVYPLLVYKRHKDPKISFVNLKKKSVNMNEKNNLKIRRKFCSSEGKSNELKW